MRILQLFLRFFMPMIIVFTLMGCANSLLIDPTPQPIPEPTINGVRSIDELKELLIQSGLTVVDAEQYEQEFFGRISKNLLVNGELVQVFDYTTEQGATEDSKYIGDTILGNGSVAIDWLHAPHAYHSGAVNVLYVGNDATLLAALSTHLGEPYVVGPSRMP